MWKKAEFDRGYITFPFRGEVERQGKSSQWLELSTCSPGHSLCVEGEMVHGEKIFRITDSNEWPDKLVKGLEGKSWNFGAKSSEVKKSGRIHGSQHQCKDVCMIY